MHCTAFNAFERFRGIKLAPFTSKSFCLLKCLVKKNCLKKLIDYIFLDENKPQFLLLNFPTAYRKNLNASNKMIYSISAVHEILPENDQKLTFLATKLYF